MTDAPEQHAFQAEVAQILRLMVHSVYTDREIFLRELVSNASDALDKLRYLALTTPELTAGDADLGIHIRPDVLKRSLTVSDNGIGMDREELIDNLGTIARSGTRAFIERMAGAGDQASGLIGQFGVGFYAAFMVADEVEVRSRKAGSEAVHIWRSDGGGGFTVTPASEEEAAGTPRGTSVTLLLKDDALEFLEESRLDRIVRTYSDHILFPIVLDLDGQPARQLNEASALWTRPKAEITAREYAELYRHLTGQFDEPAVTIHSKAEGRSEYTALLFVPASRPFDLYDPARKGRVKLYVRRVFISDDADLLPPYLRFVRGVIDSQDMPLNISREMLQRNPQVAAIRKAVTGRVLGELKTLAEKDAEAYGRIWTTFGAVLKEGLYEDAERRDALYELLRFRTSTGGQSLRSLEAYIGALKPNQTAIYYATGDTIERLAASPQLEGYRARGIEVLLLADPVDNFWVTTALGYDGKPFKSVTQGSADLDGIPLQAEAEAASRLSPVATGVLLDRMRRTLGEAVGDVRISSRLVDSPACLVAPEGGPDRGLERILSRQAQGAGQAPILEINTRHALIVALEARARAADPAAFEDMAWVLLDQARILEGDPPADPARFGERLSRLLLGGAA